MHPDAGVRPAAGVIGTKALCERIGLENAIAFDMGGTTAKAGVIHRGTVLMTSSTLVGGYAEGLPVQVPMIDIQEVGTGGGSIAQVGLAGALRVGPHSAGAVPGPACYGLGGTEPTVTDANLVLGRISADRFLGGEMPLDLDAAKAAIKEKIGAPLGLDLIAAADGIIRIAATKMSHVVRWVTTERGLDASDFAFVAYGGAGPLHAATVARELQAATVIVPRAPGHFSAFGMLVADPRRDFVRTWFKLLEDAAFDNVETMYAEMESEGRRAIGQARLNLLRITVTRGADMRYVGQEHAVTVDLPLDLFVRRDRAAIKAHFDAVHEQRYGYAAPKEEAEIVSLRSAVIGQLHKPAIEEIARGKPRASQIRVPRGSAGLFQGSGWICRNADLRSCGAAGWKSDLGSGARRGICLDDGCSSGRRAARRRVRQFGDRNWQELIMDDITKAPAGSRAGAKVDPVRSRSCVMA